MKKFGHIALRVLLWITGIVIVLVLSLFIAIRIPSVQQWACNQAVNYLEGKIGTKVEVNKISLNLPKLLVLEDIYVEDQQRDTLIAGDTLKVDISLLKLLDSKLEINEIDFRGITVNIHRNADSVFNFDYITKAFAGEQKKEPTETDTTSTMKFSVEKINLDRIKVAYTDAPTANDIKFYLGHFDTKIKQFDLDKMQFDIPKITTSGIDVRMVQSKLPVEMKSQQQREIESATPINIGLKLGTLNLNKIRVYYQNDISAMKADINLGKALIESKTIDLQKQHIILKALNLEHSTILFQLGKKAEAKVVAQEATEAAAATANNWRFASESINLFENNIVFDNFNMPVQKQGMDFGHLSLKQLSLKLESLKYSPDSISGNLLSGRLEDKSGFALQKLQTNFLYHPKGATLENLLIQTPNTLLRDNIKISYPNLSTIAKQIGEIGIDANIKKSYIGTKDIVLLYPDIQKMMPLKSEQRLNIDTRILGKVKNLEIPHLTLSGLSGTTIVATAKTKGLPDANKAWLDVKIDKFETKRTDILSLLPKGTLPDNISLPEIMKLKGFFKGSMTNFTTDLNLNSSYGSARAIASYHALRKGQERYKANIRAYNLDAGKFIKNDSIGKINLAANVVGEGLDPKTMRTKVAGRVISAYYNGYTYRNLSLDGTANGGSITAKANMADPNISFKLNGAANMAKKYPAVKMELTVDSINFNQLNLMNSDLRFHGKLSADLATADPDYLNGRIVLSEALIAKGKDRFTLDTVSIRSVTNRDSSAIQLRAEFMSANMHGQYKLSQLGAAFQNILTKYFSSPGKKPAPPSSPQILAFDARIVSTPIIRKIMPDLKELATINLSGSLDTRTQSFALDGSIPRILYGGNDVNNLQLKVMTTDTALNYNVSVAQLNASSIKLYAALIKGDIRNNNIHAEISTRDKKNKENYRIAGNLAALNDGYKFSLNPDGLMLNYDKWQVTQNNAISFGSKGIAAQSFEISNAQQKISINSNPPGFNNPLDIAFNNFKIETLTRIAGQDSLLLGGTINGKANVSKLNTSPVFTADLKVDDLSFRGDTVGNITAKVDNQTANAFAANVSITGQGNLANLTGFYYTDKSALDMKLDIQRLNMKSIEGFTMGNVRNSRGYIRGNLAISGSANTPSINGNLGFNDLGFNIAMLNSDFRIDNNASVNFNSEGIRLSNFTLIDSVNNKASLNGTIYTKTYTDFRFDLALRANNFRVINSGAQDNDLYYGKLFINTRLNVKGTMESPIVDGSLKINPETNLFLVLPNSDPGIVDKKGVVEFVDKKNPLLSKVFKKPVDTLNKSEITGMDISVNIELDKEAILNVIVDPGNGDMLTMRGTAELTGGIDPSGKTNLTGLLTLEEGSYNLSFNFLKRKFSIKKGSTMSWNGDPLGATVDITATYRVNAAPIDLVEAQLSGTDRSTLNTYKQKLPFDVNLTLKEDLMEPNISFDIQLPEGNYNVASNITNDVTGKLTQLRTEPAEMNKQVFALLLLNRFIAENPFQSNAGGSLESTAIQSVSQLLSDQLNNLAGSLIEGVDLTVGLASSDDYTTGELRNRTDLNVGVSKRLLNDRLKVSVGSNFELDGPSQPNRKTNNIAGDIQVEYQLSKDGRYLLRAYQKNEYQVALQGQVIETGVGFVLTMDYNRFKEIFQKKKTGKNRQRRAANR